MMINFAYYESLPKQDLIREVENLVEDIHELQDIVVELEDEVAMHESEPNPADVLSDILADQKHRIDVLDLDKDLTVVEFIERLQCNLN